jgi:hypothetical protein
MNVWVIGMYSTGERWHTVVCASNNRAKIVLHGYAMSREHGTDDSEYQDWRNPRDISQTATVQRLTLLSD